MGKRWLVKYGTCAIALIVIAVLWVLLIKKEDTDVVKDDNKLRQSSNAPTEAPYTRMKQIEKTLSIDKNSLTLKEIDDPDSLCDIYTDENGTEYLYVKESGNLAGFIDMGVYEGPKQSQTCDGQELKIIADEVASKLVNVSKYEEQTYHYQEDTGIHQFTYTRIAGGYPTTEIGYVFLTPAGDVQMVMFQADGKFDNVIIPVIDEKKLDEQLYSKVKVEYNETVIEYEIMDRVLNYSNGVLHMEYYLKCTAKDGNLSMEIVEVSVE